MDIGPDNAVSSMHDHLGLGRRHRLADRVGIQSVGHHWARSQAAHQVLLRGVPGHPGHLVASRHELRDEHSAESACGAGHEDLHDCSSRPSRCARSGRRRCSAARPGGPPRSTTPGARTGRATTPAASPTACPRPWGSPGVPDGGWSSHTCSGIRPPSLAAPAMAASWAFAVAPAVRLYSPRSPAKIGHARPRVARVSARERVPRLAVELLAVAVEVGAVPEAPVGGVDGELLVDDGDRVEDRRVVGALDAEAHELEEARVDDRALVGRARPAVADRVGAAVVGVGVLGHAQVVGLVGVRAVGGGRPALDALLPRVGGLLVGGRARVVAVLAREVGGADQPGDLRGDRARRPAVLVLPAVHVGPRAGLDEPVGRRLDVLGVGLRVVAMQLPREDEREGDLVLLGAVPVRRAVDEGVLPDRAVGTLLLVEHEAQRALGGAAVAGRHHPGDDLVEVARPHRVVDARLGELEPGPPRPRHRRGGDEGAAVGLVLVGGQDHDRLVVLGAVGLRARRRGA